MVLSPGFVMLLRQHELMESVRNFENGNEKDSVALWHYLGFVLLSSV
jgi:hypothetical protein